MHAQVADLLEIPAGIVGRTVAEVMVERPKTLAGAATVAEARAELLDEHVHLVLLVQDGTLVGTLDRADLAAAPADAPASAYAVLAGRTVAPGVPAGDAWVLLRATDRRRLAVVDDDGVLLGLLCLKRRLTGFCS
ncbi:MAG TPA: CBS domain-containing protein, partial [Nocardioides sp.]|nr:CBS domain-containing protein [Nocardioides sp.]